MATLKHYRNNIFFHVKIKTFSCLLYIPNTCSLSSLNTFGHIMSMVSCQKGPTRHAYAWQIGPFRQDTLDVCFYSSYYFFCIHAVHSTASWTRSEGLWKGPVFPFPAGW